MKKKRRIANMIMAGIIVAMIAGGVFFAGNTMGWFDQPDAEVAQLQEVRGLVRMYRDSVSYTVERPVNLRKGDVLTCETGGIAVIGIGDSSLTIGEKAELKIEDAAADSFSAEVTQGEVFANCGDALCLKMEDNRVQFSQTVAHISVRKSAQTIRVFSGSVQDAAAGQKLECLNGEATIGTMQVEELNDFTIAQLRLVNKQSSTFFSDAQLDKLVADRNQALQDAINGTQPGGSESTDPDQSGHTHRYDVQVIAPSCTTGGYALHTCSCGDTYKDQETAPTGHTYQEETVSATCTAGGYTKHTCACGDTYTDQMTSAKGHIWMDWITVKQPTSAEEGRQKRTCAHCDAAEESAIAKIPPSHIHNYQEKVVAATCTTGGYTLYTCSCGVSYKDRETAAKGHAYTEKVIKPTCTTGGYTQHTCRCGAQYTDQIVTAPGHAWGNWEVVKKPTTTQPGLQKRTCSACKQSEEQTLPKQEFVVAGYVYLTIRCDTILNNMGDLNPAKAEFVPADGVILPQVKVAFAEGESVFDVLVRACETAKIQLEYSWTPMYDTYYIEGINNLYEFDCGGESGWMYKVNEWFPNYGVSDCMLKDGDAIAFLYSCAGLGTDVGAPEWEG